MMKRFFIAICLFCALSAAGGESAPALGDVLVNEDFSGMSKGSEDFPEMSVQIFAGTYPPVIDSQYTSQPGWEGEGVFQAGGCVFFNSDTYHYLQTPPLDLSANSGCATVYFRARAFSGTTTLMAGNTDYGAPTFKSFYSFPVGTGWQEFSFTTVLGEASEIVQFQAMNALIDDVRVVVEGLPAPKALPCIAYTYTSALAHWEPVEQAESYNLYFYRLSTLTWEYEIEQVYRGIKATEFFLNDLDRNSYYGYQVTCVANGRESAKSNWIDLCSEIGELTVEPCSDFNGDSFTANWQGHDAAKSYNVWLFVDEWDNSIDTWIYRHRGTFTADEGATSLHIADVGLDPDSTYYYTVQAVDRFGVESPRSDYIAAMPAELQPAVAQAATNVSTNGFTACWQPSQWANGYVVDLFRTTTATQGGEVEIARGDFSATASTGSAANPTPLFDSNTFTDDGFCYWSIMPLAASARGLMGIDNTAQGLFGTSFMISPQLNLSGGSITVSAGAVGKDITHAYVCTAQLAGNVYNIDQYQKVDISSEMTEFTATLPAATDQSFIVIYTDQPGYLLFSHLSASITLAPGASVTAPFATRLAEGDATEQPFTISDWNAPQQHTYVVSALRITPRTILRAKISNAVNVPFPASAPDVECSPTMPSEFYDLYGRRVANPASGSIYLRRNGSNSSKIVY